MVLFFSFEEVVKVGDLVTFVGLSGQLDRWFGIVLDVNWESDQALIYWSGSATHYEYLDEIEVIQ